jgi:hypothetical protein
MARNYLYFKTLLSAGQKKHFCHFPEADSQLLGGLVHDQALETPTLEQPKEFEDNHDNDNHSNYVKDASVHAGDSYQIARAMVNIYPNLSAITAFHCSEDSPNVPTCNR